MEGNNQGEGIEELLNNADGSKCDIEISEYLKLTSKDLVTADMSCDLRSRDVGKWKKFIERNLKKKETGEGKKYKRI